MPGISQQRISDANPDVYGQALYDYYSRGKAAKLKLYTSYGQREIMPVDWFFREDEDFPELERQALALVRGKVLDIGAGAGSHAVYLAGHGYEVHTLDESPFCVRIMQERGLPVVLHQSCWTATEERYDTLMMLMNGIGLVGRLEGLRHFLVHVRQLLNPGGQILFDSSDLSYLYPDQQLMLYPYRGEISYMYEYLGRKGKPFTWLYIDQQTMRKYAADAGWNMEIIFEDSQDQYLAKLS